MKVSVIIPARNEEANIGRTLGALAEQSLSKTDFEVVLVDNGSTDGTARIAETYSSLLRLRIVVSKGTSIAQVRNDGARIAEGQVLAFLDADCTPDPSWLEQALALRPHQSIWGAHYAVPKSATWVGRVWEKFQAMRVEGSTRFLPTSNLFVMQEDFRRLGGFAASQQTSEDVDFSFRARRHGLDVVAIPVLAIVHEGTPSTISDFFRQNYWHGQHVLRMFMRNLPALKSLPLILASVYELLTLIAVMAGAVFVILRGHVALVLVPSLFFLLPAVLLSLWKTLKARCPEDIAPLAFLYVVYFTARALSLVMPVSTGHRRPAT